MRSTFSNFMQNMSLNMELYGAWRVSEIIKFAHFEFPVSGVRVKARTHSGLE